MITEGRQAGQGSLPRLTESIQYPLPPPGPPCAAKTGFHNRIKSNFFFF